MSNVGFIIHQLYFLGGFLIISTYTVEYTPPPPQKKKPTLIMQALTFWTHQPYEFSNQAMEALGKALEPPDPDPSQHRNVPQKAGVVILWVSF